MQASDIVWKVIPQVQGLYEVSNFGDLRERETHKIVRVSENSKGYAIARLSLLEPPLLIKVHKYVALMFCPKPTGAEGNTNRLEVDHIDHCRMNNEASNLRWVTAKENCRNRHRTSKPAITHKDKAVLVTKGTERKVFATAKAAAQYVGRGTATVQGRLQTGRPTKDGYRLQWIDKMVDMPLFEGVL